MNFSATYLPDKAVFQNAFSSGWSRYLTLHADDEKSASLAYMRGPVAMARLIVLHGGECREVAAAACLAGPSLFSISPADGLSSRLYHFSHELKRVDDAGSPEIIDSLSGDVRIFLQASAIMLLEHHALHAGKTTAEIYREALQLYSAARGANDVYKMDTRFEIAAMKATTFMENPAHIWALRQGHKLHGARA